MTENIKTGTTCIGLLFKNGVVLAADKRVTSYKIDSEAFTKTFELTDKIRNTNNILIGLIYSKYKRYL